MRISIATAALALAACNQGAITIASDADYQTLFVKAVCAYQARCGVISRSAEAQCVIDYTHLVTSIFTAYSIDDERKAGRIFFDGDAAQRCLDAVGRSGCGSIDFLRTEAQSCTAQYAGRVALGGACRLVTECVDGWCIAGGKPAVGCAGTCQAFAATGSPCDPTVARCAPSDYCDDTGLCAHLVAGGGSCTFSGMCQGQQACRIAAAATTGTCGPPGQAGDACQSSFGCAPGLYCDGQHCQSRLAAQAACSDPDSCADGLQCVANGAPSSTCQPPRDLGQSCVSSDACAHDAACDPAAHTCTLKGQAGADCAAGSCGGPFYCDPQNQCLPRPGFGEPCIPPPSTGGIDPCFGGSCDPATRTCALSC